MIAEPTLNDPGIMVDVTDTIAPAELEAIEPLAAIPA